MVGQTFSRRVSDKFSDLRLQCSSKTLSHRMSVGFICNSRCSKIHFYEYSSRDYSI